MACQTVWPVIADKALHKPPELVEDTFGLVGKESEDRGNRLSIDRRARDNVELFMK